MAVWRAVMSLLWARRATTAGRDSSDDRHPRSCAGRTINCDCAPSGSMVAGLFRARRPGPACQPGVILWILHKSEGDREHEPELRVRQVPAGQVLDPADAIGDSVAMDTQGTGGAGEAAPVENGPQCGEVLAPDVGPASQERLEEGPGEPLAVPEVVQRAKEAVDRQANRLDHRTRAGKGLGRLEHGSGVGLGRRAVSGGVEGPRERDGTAEEGGDPG